MCARTSVEHTSRVLTAVFLIRRQAPCNQVRVPRCVAIKKWCSASGFTVVPPPPVPLSKLRPTPVSRCLLELRSTSVRAVRQRDFGDTTMHRLFVSFLRGSSSSRRPDLQRSEHRRRLAGFGRSRRGLLRSCGCLAVRRRAWLGGVVAALVGHRGVRRASAGWRSELRRRTPACTRGGRSGEGAMARARSARGSPR